MLFTLSIVYIRRNAYEVFLKTHTVIALLLLGLLWFHFSKSSRFFVAILAVVSGLWLGTQVLWVVSLHYRNGGFDGSVLSDVQCFQPGGRQITACRLVVPLRTHCTFKPGQYVYITIPERNFGLLQRHPYIVAWVSPDSGGSGSMIHLLVECRRGFSRDVPFCPAGKVSVILEGPYGGTQDLNGYDKVLFMAHGIGIASHLLAISHLLQCHESQKARVRRISLVWVVASEGMIPKIRCSTLG